MNKLLKTNKKVLITFLILRLLLVQAIIIELVSKNYSNVILSIITLVLFTLPVLLNKKNRIEYPSILEILLFIVVIAYEFISIVIPNLELALQVLNAFICTSLVFVIINKLNKREISLKPIFICIITISISVTLCTMWELLEYSSDMLTNTDVQKSITVTKISSKVINKKDVTKPLLIDGIDQTIIHHQNGTSVIENGYLDTGIIDTMKDLLIDLIVFILFNICGFIYLKQEN